MVRTQIQLTDAQARRIRAIARDRGLSLAEVIRQCIDRTLSEESTERGELYNKARAVVGRFTDAVGTTDLAREHDKYLQDSYG